MEGRTFRPELGETDHSITCRMELWAARHEERSEGLFVASKTEEFKDLDTAHYGWEFSEQKRLKQMVAHIKIKKGLMKLGNEMFPDGGFNTMVDELKKRRDLLEDIRSLRRENKTVLVASDHPWLMNGAVAEAAFYIALDEPRIAEHSGIIVNKMTGWLDVNVGQREDGQPVSVPVIGTLRKFGNVYCCIPRSATVDELELNAFGDDYNKKMFKPMLAQAKTGMILHANPSGSLDLSDIDESGERSITMQTVHPKTARILSKLTSAAISVVMWKERQPGTNKEALSFHIADKLTPVNDVADIHKIMKDMEDPYRELVSKATRSDRITVRYQQPFAA